MTKELRMKYENLINELKKQNKIAVAFSGGVDSTLLAYAAKEALGGNAILVTVVGAHMPGFELDDAKRLSGIFGLKHVMIPVDVNDISGLCENTRERCYHCKKAIFTEIMKTTRSLGFEHVCEGSNLSDDDDFRPGRKALEELHISSPLKISMLSKSEIRDLSREFNLDTFDKPNYACLASRVEFGIVITKEILKQVEQAEDFLRKLGFRQVRVRHHGDIARIEISVDELEKALNLTVFQEIDVFLKELGFTYVAIDTQGYKMGKMNEMVK